MTTRASVRFRTALGWIAWIQGDHGIEELRFGYATAAEAECALLATVGEPIRRGAPPAAWKDLLERYAAGEVVDFRAVPVAVPSPDSFHGRVLAACRDIPYGQTRTYGDLACQAGALRAARAVGNCMAGNRVPLLIPCHRVVPAGGRLGGFSAPGGVALKRRLLDLEREGLAGQEPA